MQAFAARETQVLVATTVIEVGIDIPNATAIVVENADRFGLAQLHQLRGRVGRGADQSYCFLFESSEATEGGLERLEALRKHASGFELAELDLRMRGEGQLSGERQAGASDLRHARLATAGRLLYRARADARYLDARGLVDERARGRASRRASASCSTGSARGVADAHRRGRARRPAAARAARRRDAADERSRARVAVRAARPGRRPRRDRPVRRHRRARPRGALARCGPLRLRRDGARRARLPARERRVARRRRPQPRRCASTAAACCATRRRPGGASGWCCSIRPIHCCHGCFRRSATSSRRWRRPERSIALEAPTGLDVDLGPGLEHRSATRTGAAVHHLFAACATPNPSRH